jgi:hypothetical protein
MTKKKKTESQKDKVETPADLPPDIDDQINELHMEEEGAKTQAVKAGFQELPPAPTRDTSLKAPPHTPERTAKDDATLTAMTEELDTFEAKYGPVYVTIADSVAAGNCESGVIAWRKENVDGKVIVSAREMLEVAAEGRDQISRVVLGIRRAMRRMSGG